MVISAFGFRYVGNGGRPFREGHLRILGDLAEKYDVSLMFPSGQRVEVPLEVEDNASLGRFLYLAGCLDFLEPGVNIGCDELTAMLG